MLYILLPVHNRRKITQNIIECFLKQTYVDYHLILIDDGSIDDTAEMVKDRIKSLSIVNGKGNWWWGGSLQKGYEWIKANAKNKKDFVLIINDDTEFDEFFFETALKILTDKPRTLLLAQCYSRDKKKLIDTGVNIDWKYFRFSMTMDPFMINVLSTRGLFFRVSDFLEIGGFYPTLIPHYQSDYEFTHRAYNKGFKLVTFPELFLYEDTSQTGIRENLDGINGFFKMYFSKKSNYYYPSWFFFILLSCPLKYKVLNLYRISFSKKIIDLLIYKIYIFKYLIFDYCYKSNKKISHFRILNYNSTLVGKIEVKKIYKLFNVESFIFIRGWAIDPVSKNIPCKSILIVFNNKIIRSIPYCKYTRIDVANHFKNDSISKSGWKGIFYIKNPTSAINQIELYSLSWDYRSIHKLT